MAKFLRKLGALAFAMLSGSLITASGAGTGVALDGYYRISNASDGKYLQVTGPFTVKPDQTLEQALAEPGSIFYIKAESAKDSHGDQAFKITSLRSQGIEVACQPGFSYEEIADALSGGSGQMSSMAHRLAHLGAQKGYMNVARGSVEFLIYFMGCYLNENYKAASGADASVDLEALTKNFIEVVAENIDLNFYLKPDGETYRIYFDIPDMQPVADWYAANKAEFDVGLAAMRYGMEQRGLPTGEYFDDDEINEMAAGGYVLPEKYRQDVDAETGQFHVPYEQVFADPDLLFAWLKLYAGRLLDPERCPAIELRGIYLPDVGKALREHRLTAKLINYMPAMRPGKRVYLISGMLSDGGKEGTEGSDYTSTGEFGFAYSDMLTAAAAAANWNVIPVSDAGANYFVLDISGEPYIFDSATENVSSPLEMNRRQSEQGYYTTIFYDFPVRIVNPEGIRLYTLTNEKGEYDSEGTIASFAYEPYPPVLPLTHSSAGKPMYYYELAAYDASATIPAHTALIAVCDEAAGNRLAIDYATQQPLFTMETTMNVGDDDAAIGHRAPMHAPAGQDNNLLKGTLLPVAAANLPDYGFDMYHATDRPAYTMTVKTAAINKRAFCLQNGTISGNSAFLLHPLGNGVPEGDYENVYIGLPHADVSTGVSDIAVDSEPETDLIHDIYGRRVSTMLPGSVYIVNGRKFIAR